METKGFRFTSFFFYNKVNFVGVFSFNLEKSIAFAHWNALIFNDGFRVVRDLDSGVVSGTAENSRTTGK